jgi:malonyl CoA-acyl carrier protein transacylase
MLTGLNGIEKIMASETWVVWDITTGEERWRSQGQTGEASKQELPPGLAAMVVPMEAIAGPTVDLATLKAYLYYKINMEAEAFSQQLVPVMGVNQAVTYMRKATEAAAYLANPESPTPILSIEASVMGTTVSQEAQAVAATVGPLTILGAAIEATRRKAKKNVEAATNLAEINTASQVDWAGAVAQLTAS